MDKGERRDHHPTRYEVRTKEELRELVWPDANEDKNRVAVDTRFLRLFGPAAGLFLGRLVFWSDKTYRDDWFVYFTKETVKVELGLASTYEADQVRHRLEAAGVVKTEKMARRRKDGTVWSPSPVLHYQVKFAVLAALLDRYEEDPEGTVATLNLRFKKSKFQHSDGQNGNVQGREYAKYEGSSTRNARARIGQVGRFLNRGIFRGCSWGNGRGSARNRF